MSRVSIIAIILGAVVGVVSADPKTDRLKASNRAYSREVRTDYDSVPGKVVHWYADGHARTNTPFRVDLHIVTNCYELTLENERKIANKMRKIKDDQAKAAKNDQKNLEKAVKELKKLQDKSSEEMYQLFQDAIDIFEGREETK